MTIPIVFSHQKLKDDIFAEERSIWEEISQVNKSKDENTEYVDTIEFNEAAEATCVQENVSKRSKVSNPTDKSIKFVVSVRDKTDDNDEVKVSANANGTEENDESSGVPTIVEKKLRVHQLL